MPTGSGVVDAFKNLIRHGRNHRHHSNNPSSSSPTVSTEPICPPPKDAAEIIVNEEREARNKLPSYKGLENYKLLDKMGDGAFSNVYKAIDLTTGHKVAVKVVRKYELNAQQAGEKHLNRQFKKKPRATERTNTLKEVQIMRGIHHPSIVKLHSFSESPEHYFLVLELMDGGELFHQIVRLTYFSENLARHVIVQVAQGIRHLHEERGVVHRDIKPENLLFEPIPIIPAKNPMQNQYDEDKEAEGEFIPGVGGGGIGRVKIADFGLSKVVWNEHTMTPCGTVGYTAPEIVKDQRYSKSVDMWALGCVLYTLLCGFPPFYDESINVLTEKVARGYYTFLSPWWDDISSSAKDLITHLLCVDPEKRYTIDEFLAHPWCNEALAPPPPPTPLAFNHRDIFATRPLDSPLLAALGGRPEGRSPGLATLKEAFDITYAVHRMEEESARRRKYGMGVRQFLGGLNEDEEEDYNLGRGDASDDSSDDSHLEHAEQLGTTALQGMSLGDRKPDSKGISPGGFQLDLDGATLLGRRHGKSAGVSEGSLADSPLRLDALRVSDAPGAGVR
jgi:serine/threonine protein kinase